jgi:mono/diheme cytochrome c family protein
VSATESGEDIEMPTVGEAQDIINAAFPTALPQLANHAWLAVDVYDTNGVELAGKTISSTVTPDGFAYIDCTGAPSTTAATVACPDRDNVMYLAYFTSAAEATVTVDGINKIAPLNLGEVTVLEYEVAAAEPVPDEPVPDQPSAGQLVYETYCISCHADATRFVGFGSLLTLDNLGDFANSMAFLETTMTQEELDALAVYLDVELAQ